MTATATHILEEFRQLAPAEKRDLLATIAQEATAGLPPRTARVERHGTNRIRLDPALANEIALADACNPEET